MLQRALRARWRLRRGVRAVVCLQAIVRQRVGEFQAKQRTEALGKLQGFVRHQQNRKRQRAKVKAAVKKLYNINVSKVNTLIR